MGNACSSCFGKDTEEKPSSRLTSEEERRRKRELMGQAAQQRALQKVEEALEGAGFEIKLPENSLSYATGDGNAIEEAPIGYYRYHFWLNDEQAKEHENWITNTDLTGPICVSIVEEATFRQKFYRLLFRSVFGTKSALVFEDDVVEHFSGASVGVKDKKYVTKLRVLGVGLKMFFDHEKEKMVAMEDEYGTMSIKTANTSLSMAGNELVRSLPSSRLRENSDNGALGGEGSLLSRRVSQRNSSNNPTLTSSFLTRSPSMCHGAPLSTLLRSPSIVNVNQAVMLERSGTLRKCFKEIIMANPFELAKSFTLVKDKGFPTVLLELEMAMQPKLAHIDLIVAKDSSASKEQRERTWTHFKTLLGKRIERAVFKEQHKFLSKQGRISSSDITITTDCIKNAQFCKDDRPERVTKRAKMIQEVLENEKSYVQKLEMIDELFIQKLTLVDSSHNQNIISKAEFKNIFEGFEKYLPLHRKILTNLQSTNDEEKNEGDRDQLRLLSRVIRELTRLSTEKELQCYKIFINDFANRYEAIKNLKENNQEFFRLVEEASHDERSNRNPLDQLFGNFFQHVMRYGLLLGQIISETLEEEEISSELMRAYRLVSQAIRELEECKDRHDDTVKMMELANKIQNFPNQICSANRLFIAKMAAYEVERGETIFEKRLTLFLFNDMLLAARKKRTKSGKVEAKDGRKRFTHEFIFVCPIRGIIIKDLDIKAKARKYKARPFSLEIDPNQAEAWVNDRCVPLNLVDEEDASTNFILVPKKQDKFRLFSEKFNHSKNQLLVAAEIYHKKAYPREHEIFFHVYQQEDYENWEHRKRLAVLYSHSAPLPDIESLFGHAEALVVIQALGDGFRWIVRSRDRIMTSDEYIEPSQSFEQIESCEEHLIKTIVNCHILHSIYPPFGPQLELQARQLLLRHVEPYSRGMLRKFKEIVNKMHRTSLTPSTDSESIASVEKSGIEFDLPEDEKKKPSGMFGKIFSRVKKSPLGCIRE